MREWRALQLALAFLTTFPIPHIHKVKDGDFARASAYYPIAGYVVGLVVALVLWLPLPISDGVQATLAVAAWLAITGMLHFDGLVDSADALFAMKSPSQRLDILKDIHVGAFGLATGVLALLMYWSLLSGWLPFFAPIIAAVAARTILLLPMNLYPAARSESLGARSREGRWGVAVLLAAPAWLLPIAWLAWLLGIITALLLARFAARRLGGGLNGDSYGMIVIGVELVVLMVLSG